jgi:RNA polymerase sigma-70 factor, ECF subfamily
LRDDDVAMSAQGAIDHGAVLLALYGDALPQVYGYLRRRCGSDSVAEELTSETFLAAVTSAKSGLVQEVTTAWLIGIARHKLMDHYRRATREERNLRIVEDIAKVHDDRWDMQINEGVAAEILSRLGIHHRSALTLRYLDGLSVPEVATTLGRTVHATEALLVRAKNAFRSRYEATMSEGSDDGY